MKYTGSRTRDLPPYSLVPCLCIVHCLFNTAIGHITVGKIYIYTRIRVNGCVRMFKRNSGTPGAISTKLGTHMAVCMYKNLMYILL
jgi:hypothetical protein